MTGAGIPAETEATLLLCGVLHPEREASLVGPMNVREFNGVLRVLRRLDISLSDLLSDDGQARFRGDYEGGVLWDSRLGVLLDRRNEMRSAIERWRRLGVWVIDRTHPDYPCRYSNVLGDRAPPLLYGAGDRSLLNGDTKRLAIVGSRDIDSETAGFATNVGHHAAEQGVTVVSGGARGVDRTAVDGVLERKGSAIVVLPGELVRALAVRRFQTHVHEGRLVLLSPYPPEEAFSGENALGRNRLIYCLGDLALVVSATSGKGGTWSGATETLRRGWVPVYVRQDGDSSSGNQGLIDLGGYPVSHDLVDDPARFAAWFEASTQQARSTKFREGESAQLGLFPES